MTYQFILEGDQYFFFFFYSLNFFFFLGNGGGGPWPQPVPPSLRLWLQRKIGAFIFVFKVCGLLFMNTLNSTRSTVT
jgi:hypothetical protein